MLEAASSSAASRTCRAPSHRLVEIDDQTCERGGRNERRNEIDQAPCEEHESQGHDEERQGSCESRGITSPPTIRTIQVSTVDRTKLATAHPINHLAIIRLVATDHGCGSPARAACGRTPPKITRGSEKGPTDQTSGQEGIASTTTSTAAMPMAQRNSGGFSAR